MDQILPRTRPLPPTLARLPPLTALRAFVATARHLNFTKAAEELHVTSAAIGQQVRQLEDHLGAPLFLRDRGQLRLTEVGRELMPGLTEAFDGLVASVARVFAADLQAPLRISVAPSFAAKWLVPRLDSLREALPGIEVQVDASTALVDLAEDGFDCAIRYGRGTYPGLNADLLFNEAVVPVCTPAFAEANGLLGRPEAMRSVTLLAEEGFESDPSCPDWRSWLRLEGLPSQLAGPSIGFSLSSLVIDAALGGHGLGLAKARLADADIAAGRLLVPFGKARPALNGYYFVVLPRRAGSPAVAAMRDWLTAEVGKVNQAPAAA
jgi:LysR family glycine cleavage system transcriptional activator